eukprot:9265809-Lingulodinium_polyedra.AAC.1
MLGWRWRLGLRRQWVREAEGEFEKQLSYVAGGAANGRVPDGIFEMINKTLAKCARQYYGKKPAERGFEEEPRGRLKLLGEMRALRQSVGHRDEQGYEE